MRSCGFIVDRGLVNGGLGKMTKIWNVVYAIQVQLLLFSSIPRDHRSQCEIITIF